LRILILIDDYLPSTKSGAKMMHELGLQLLRMGNQIVVLTPSPTVQKKLNVSMEGGLRVVRVKTGRLKGVSKVHRAFNEMRLSSALWRGARSFLTENRCDLIVYYSPTIFFGNVVKKLKAIWKCPSYLVLRDIFPKWAVEAGVLRKGPVYRYFRFKELAQYRAADMIGVESPGNVRYFSDELRAERLTVEVLPNWASSEEVAAVRHFHRRELGLDGKVVFFYGGNIGIAQDVDNIVRLANSLQDHPEIFFLLVGEGSEVARLNIRIAELGLGNIRILPSVPQGQYLAMLREFDVGILSLHRNLTSHNIPGKLLGYMACQKPVLASVNPTNDLCRVLNESRAGFSCENGDDTKLRTAALLLAGDSHLRETMGNNSRRLLESRFSDNVAARQILSHFSNIAEPHVHAGSDHVWAGTRAATSD
jgi:O26-antigen biosynthesis N-acetyl-L-fucosamine transferase